MQKSAAYKYKNYIELYWIYRNEIACVHCRYLLLYYNYMYKMFVNVNDVESGLLLNINISTILLKT